MSETYYLVKKIIKNKYKEHYGANTKQKSLIAVIFISLGFGILSFSKFYNLYGKVFLIISAIFLVYFYFLLYKESKVNNNEPQELIAAMKKSLANENINSLKLIELLQEEICNKLNVEEKDQAVLFKRISVIFISIFWIPFAFLTKYLIEQSISELTWNDYVSISGSLLVISLQFIGIVIATGNQIDNFMSIAKRDLLLTHRYLNDIKYLYIMEEVE